MSSYNFEKVCAECKKVFVGSYNTKYCSMDCRSKVQNKRVKEWNKQFIRIKKSAVEGLKKELVREIYAEGIKATIDQDSITNHEMKELTSKISMITLKLIDKRLGGKK